MTYGIKVSLPEKDISSNTPNDFVLNSEYTSVKIYQEYLGYLYIKELLEKDFIVKRNVHYTETDFIIKPKINNNDELNDNELNTDKLNNDGLNNNKLNNIHLHLK